MTSGRRRIWRTTTTPPEGFALGAMWLVLAATAWFRVAIGAGDTLLAGILSLVGVAYVVRAVPLRMHLMGDQASGLSGLDDVAGAA